LKTQDFDIASAREQALSLVARVLDEAARRKADAAEVSVGRSYGFSATVRMGEVETLEHENDQDFVLTVYFGKRKATVSSSDLRAASVSDMVAAACAIAGEVSEDECAGLCNPDDLAAAVADLDLDRPWSLDIGAAVELATECEDSARAAPEIVNSEGASVHTVRALHCYGNSHGFSGGWSGTRHGRSCLVVAGDDGGMQRDGWYSVNRYSRRLATRAQVGARAAERAVRRLGARKIASCKAPVLFVPEMARTLFGCFISAVSGPALYRKTTFLQDTLGRRVFPEWLCMDEEPLIRGGLHSAPFDLDGVGTRTHAIVRDGVLDSYVLDSYSARRLGLHTTGNAGGVRNLAVRSNAGGFNDLVAEMGTGLVVTELIGSGINPVTGDYSQGAAGFWVENGALAYPVEEITVAGNLKDMFASVARAGDDVDERSSIRCGSLLLPEMTVAGK